MWINAKLNNINKNDTIVLANNRQVLAFKRTWGIQKGNSALPKALSWQQYLQQVWHKISPNSSKRLISIIESRMLIKRSMQKLEQEFDNHLLDEVIKNNNYCHAHQIHPQQLSASHIQNCKLFATWIKDYQQFKLNNHLLDNNDLSTLIIKHPFQIAKPYVYGFKTLTPEQSKLLNHIGYHPLNARQINTKINYATFKTTDNELLYAAKWMKSIHLQHPQKHIAIVCPNLNQSHYQIKSIFDQVFSDTLTETGEKSYNISLGFPLSEYSLIRHIFTLLELCEQLQNNHINTQTLNAVIISPYIAYAQQEQFKRILLVERVLSLSKTHLKFKHLEKHLSITPQLKNLIESTLSQPIKTYQSYDQWLLLFATHLQTWGFATDRSLSSSEYQLFNKYQNASLGLNQLAQTNQKVNITHALLDLKNWLSQVIFQPKSAKTPLQILGSLEAEGLFFDYAWVLDMTDNFLPVSINTPRFIPIDIAQQHQIPCSNFDLITKETKNTLNNLKNLATEVTFSYAKLHFESDQRPSPLLVFPQENSILNRNYESPTLEILTDIQIAPITNQQINNGVNILKDQMACAFKGFTHRLNIKTFNAPHIGLNKIQQGNIVHCILQYLYQEITSQKELLALNNDALKTQIKQKTTQALNTYPNTAFKKIEQTRLETLIFQFIEKIEKNKVPFNILSTEKKIHVNINNLQFTTKLDRLDEIENGDKIIFDYKTNKPSVSNWLGTAIKDPQLPIYAISNDAQGIAFIQLNADKISVKGISRDPDSLPKQKIHKLYKDWDTQIKIWKKTLNAASQDFQTGKSSVTPTKDACVYCKFNALCRIEN